MTWMGALERGAEWQQAVLLLDSLIQDQLDPDPLLWSAFVNVCENAGQPALSFLSQVESRDDDGMLILAIRAMGRRPCVRLLVFARVGRYVLYGVVHDSLN